jgi:hypothetical protein
MAAIVGSTTTDASGNGYRVVLPDDFSNGYQIANWGWAFNGGFYWNRVFSWNAGDVNVGNSETQVTDTRHADGFWTADGFSSFKAGQTITYGTVKFDARGEAVQGTQAAILMWPASDVWSHDGEIDILALGCKISPISAGRAITRDPSHLPWVNGSRWNNH